MMMHVLSPSKHAFFYSVLVAVFLLATPTKATLVTSMDAAQTIPDEMMVTSTLALSLIHI